MELDIPRGQARLPAAQPLWTGSRRRSFFEGRASQLTITPSTLAAPPGSTSTVSSDTLAPASIDLQDTETPTVIALPLIPRLLSAPLDPEEPDLGPDHRTDRSGVTEFILTQSMLLMQRLQLRFVILQPKTSFSIDAGSARRTKKSQTRITVC